jgi:hypothetical protein
MTALFLFWMSLDTVDWYPRCGYCNLWNNWCQLQFWCFGTCSCLKIFNWAFIPIEFWKDRAILKPFWMFFVCFHPFSNKVKIVHLRAGCFLKLDSRWKLSFYFHYYWIQWTRQKYWNFFFQIYINFSAVFCEQNFGIFYLVDKSKISNSLCILLTISWLKVWFLYLRLIWVRCPVGKVLFAGRLSVLLQWRLVVFFFLIRIRVG